MQASRDGSDQTEQNAKADQDLSCLHTSCGALASDALTSCTNMRNLNRDTQKDSISHVRKAEAQIRLRICAV